MLSYHKDINNAIKNVGESLKALILAHPVIASIAAIGAVTFAVAKAADYMGKSLERQKEKLASAKTNYKEYEAYVDTDPLKTSQELLAQVNEPDDGFGIHIVAS